MSLPEGPPRLALAASRKLMLSQPTALPPTPPTHPPLTPAPTPTTSAPHTLMPLPAPWQGGH
jgi:hypothetical protein